MKFGTIVLMYHCVYRNSVRESGFQSAGAYKYKIREDIFSQHLSAIDQYCKTGKFNRQSILFTFDDGGISFYNVIAPLLEKYGFRGYFFISTSYIGQETFLKESEIVDLANRGHIIGAHAHTHKNLSLMSYKDQEDEWTNSCAILTEILGKSVKYVSIPGGYFTKESQEILQSLGVDYIFTSQPSRRIRQSGAISVIGRFAIDNSFNPENVINLLRKYSFARIKQTIRYEILSAAKQILGAQYVKIRILLLAPRK